MGAAGALPHPAYTFACDAKGMCKHGTHQHLTFAFTRSTGFTDMSKQVAPQVVMSFLNE